MSSRVQMWLGYHFGLCRMWPPYGHGVVLTPKWVAKITAEKWRGPVIVDNGAYSAWINKKPISLEEQTTSVGAAVLELRKQGFTVRAAILPDVVGDGAESQRRCEEALAVWRGFKCDLWTPIQEGTDLSFAVHFADGVFVGGKSKMWKLEVAKELRAMGAPWVHVGRQSTEKDLIACNTIDVDSVDSTNPTRTTRNNTRTDWGFVLGSNCTSTRRLTLREQVKFGSVETTADEVRFTFNK